MQKPRSRVLLSVLLGFALAASCSLERESIVAEAYADGVPPAPRLHERAVVADGVHQPTGDYLDTQRGEVCAFVETGPGVLHCLPPTVASVGPYFGDPDCGKPLVSAPAGLVDCFPHAYAIGVELGDPACSPQTTHVYEVGAPLLPSAGVFALGVSCVAVAPVDTSSYALFELGAEVPLDAFVEGSIKAD